MNYERLAYQLKKSRSAVDRAESYILYYRYRPDPELLFHAAAELAETSERLGEAEADIRAESQRREREAESHTGE
jgi:hypothetical protein